jgi:hypothetical protein
MNKTLFRMFLTGVVALGLAVFSSAAEPEAKKPKGPSKADLKKYDADHDGDLDEAENANRKADAAAKRAAKRQERLQKYDENGDGKINKGAEADREKADKAAAAAARRQASDAKKK